MLRAIALALTGLGSVVNGAAAPGIDVPAVDIVVRTILEAHGDGVVAGLWVGGQVGPAWYSWEPHAVRPTASAIKTSFLLELFDKYADTLDQPPPELDDVLADLHPAVAHFSAAQREEIRKGLAGASVRRLGGVMMGSVAASNLVYNAAANVVTALLGGPEALTRAVRARDAAFAPIAVRRYMLAPRDVSGDNEGTPAALAAVLQHLASGTLPGVEEKTITSLRQAVLTKDEYLGLGGTHHVKEGALDSDPLTRVHSGWWRTPGGSVVVYVVMTAQPGPGPRPRAEAGSRLAATAAKLTRLVLDAAANRTSP
jgi:hypothetical protein